MPTLNPRHPFYYPPLEGIFSFCKAFHGWWLGFWIVGHLVTLVDSSCPFVQKRKKMVWGSSTLSSPAPKVLLFEVTISNVGISQAWSRGGKNPEPFLPPLFTSIFTYMGFFFFFVAMDPSDKWSLRKMILKKRASVAQGSFDRPAKARLVEDITSAIPELEGAILVVSLEALPLPAPKHHQESKSIASSSNPRSMTIEGDSGDPESEVSAFDNWRLPSKFSKISFALSTWSESLERATQCQKDVVLSDIWKSYSLFSQFKFINGYMIMASLIWQICHYINDYFERWGR